MSKPKAPARDEAEFSSEALAAARNASATTAGAQNTQGIRPDRVAQARENIEQGVYRVQEVVLQVADRIARFVD